MWELESTEDSAMSVESKKQLFKIYSEADASKFLEKSWRNVTLYYMHIDIFIKFKSSTTKFNYIKNIICHKSIVLLLKAVIKGQVS